MTNIRVSSSHSYSFFLEEESRTWQVPAYNAFWPRAIMQSARTFKQPASLSSKSSKVANLLGESSLSHSHIVRTFPGFVLISSCLWWSSGVLHSISHSDS